MVLALSDGTFHRGTGCLDVSGGGCADSHARLLFVAIRLLF